MNLNDADPLTVQRRDPNDPCYGPQHNVEGALPLGRRVWTKGYCLSVVQVIPGENDTNIIFCSADCLCDWHGAYAAYEADCADLPDFEIPGAFVLTWITPASTLVRSYETWGDLTEQVGEYQRRILALIEERGG